MDINLESKYLEELGKGDHKAFDMLYIQYSPRLTVSYTHLTLPTNSRV